MCIDGVRLGMISAQLCFALNAHFEMNDTIKISVQYILHFNVFIYD